MLILVHLLHSQPTMSITRTFESASARQLSSSPRNLNSHEPVWAQRGRYRPTMASVRLWVRRSTGALHIGRRSQPRGRFWHERGFLLYTVGTVGCVQHCTAP
jgi:hypothetical protein